MRSCAVAEGAVKGEDGFGGVAPAEAAAGGVVAVHAAQVEVFDAAEVFFGVVTGEARLQQAVQRHLVDGRLQPVVVVIHRAAQGVGLVVGGVVAEVVGFVVEDVVAPAVLVGVVNFAAQVAVMARVGPEVKRVAAVGKQAVEGGDLRAGVVVADGKVEGEFAAVRAFFAGSKGDAALRAARGVDGFQPVLAGVKPGIIEGELPVSGFCGETLAPVRLRLLLCSRMACR